MATDHRHPQPPQAAQPLDATRHRLRRPDRAIHDASANRATASPSTSLPDSLGQIRHRQEISHSAALAAGALMNRVRLTRSVGADGCLGKDTRRRTRSDDGAALASVKVAPSGLPSAGPDGPPLTSPPPARFGSEVRHPAHWSSPCRTTPTETYTPRTRSAIRKMSADVRRCPRGDGAGAPMRRVRARRQDHQRPHGRPAT
jgi:hypothetical protein